jgi:hypothetical protein
VQGHDTQHGSVQDGIALESYARKRIEHGQKRRRKVGDQRSQASTLDGNDKAGDAMSFSQACRWAKTPLRLAATARMGGEVVTSCQPMSKQAGSRWAGNIKRQLELQRDKESKTEPQGC